MRKHIDLITYLFLGGLVIGFLSLLFYLTQENYDLLKRSNEVVIKTGEIVRAQERLSGDFKDALIYISTKRNGTPREYEDTYSSGIWEISKHMDTLKAKLSNDKRRQLDSVSKLIDVQVSWMLNNDAADPRFIDQRDQHIKSIVAIQGFFDNETVQLERSSITSVKDAERSLVRLHDWIVILIISTSVIIFCTLVLIYLQFHRLKLQNKRLREIAWVQSHKVRAPVATILGLGQLFNTIEPDDPDNHKIINALLDTTRQLDEIVKEINNKTDL